MSGDRDGRKSGFARLLAAAALAASLMLGINLAWNLHEARPSPQPQAAAVPAKAATDVLPAPPAAEPRRPPKAKRMASAVSGSRVPATVAAPAPAATPAPAPLPALSEAEKIDRLIAYIGGLQGAVFIRNGDEHTPAEAVQHLQMKRDKAGDRVKTAEDFIQLCASRSFLSGKPYLIRFADGRTRASEQVLREELTRMGP